MSINGSPSMSQVAAAFGGSAPHSLSEYYGVPFSDGGSAPGSGSISLNNFRNKTKYTVTTMSGSYSATNIPYGPTFAGWTGTWRNHIFNAPLFTVPSGFVHVPGSNFELSITLNGVIPVAGNWQYMSITIFTDNGFSAGIGFTSNGSGQGENYSSSRSTYTNKVRSTTSISSGSLSAGDQVKGRLDLYNTFFSTFAVDVTIIVGIP